MNIGWLRHGKEFLTILTQRHVVSIHLFREWWQMPGTSDPDTPVLPGLEGEHRETGRCDAVRIFAPVWQLESSALSSSPTGAALFKVVRSCMGRTAFFSGVNSFDPAGRLAARHPSDPKQKGTGMIRCLSVRSVAEDQAPCRVFATSAAKSSSFFSIPSPTATRAKATISTPASLAACSTVMSGFMTNF